ncbi:transketolase [Bacillota bacterium]
MSLDNEALKKAADKIRINIIRAVYSAGSGHPGGSLSAADILTVLYFNEMNIDPANPKMEGRDRFVLSKGHATPAIYSTLAERGFFPAEDLLTFRRMGGKLQGHPDMVKVPGVEMSTGSLGQGISASVGMALADRLDKNPARVFALLGDGELQEGLVWEAFMAAAHFKLDNLIAIIDWNGLQIDGKNDDVMCVAPIEDKLRSFRWETVVIDGHDFDAISGAFSKIGAVKDKPLAIIAKTIKGKGVSFMENDYGWHGKAPNEEQARQAIAELGGEW